MRTRLDDKIILAAALSGLGLAVAWLYALTVGSIEHELNLRVEAPIILIHGLGGDSKSWIGPGFIGFLRQVPLRYGGVLRVEWEGTDGGDSGMDDRRIQEKRKIKEVSRESGVEDPATADFYVLEASDSYGDLALWAEEIEAAIDQVQDWSGAPRVVLMGFSAGGVAARRYLVEHTEDHGVARLVTVASPNGGSPLATIGSKIVSLVDGGPKGDAILGFIETLAGTEVDAPLVRQLLPVEDGNYLFGLNRAAHPGDVEYVSVLAAGSKIPATIEDLQKEVFRIRSKSDLARALPNLRTAFMRVISIASGNHSSAGDGAVPVASQDLRNVTFFRSHPELIRAVYLLDSNHLEAKYRYPTLFRALADGLEVESVQRRDDHLEVDFHTPIPGALEIHVEDGSGVVLKHRSPRIVREGDEVIARVEIEAPEADDLPVQLSLRPASWGLARQYTLVGPDGLGVNGYQAVEHPFRVRLHSILLDHVGELDDIHLEAAFMVNDDEVWRSPVVRDAEGLVTAERLGGEVEIPLDTLGGRLSLLLWDRDVLRDPLAELTWVPGELPFGRRVVWEDSRISVDMDLQPVSGFVQVPEPLRWQ